MTVSLSNIAILLGCAMPSNDCQLTGTAIDSRHIKADHLFVALKGKYVDGHHYLGAAQQAGAVAALVSEKQDHALPQLVVTDVVKAFGEIATYWRQQSPAKVIAITGSNGKTTVKEMVASISQHCGSVIATQGNLNNELGVPLTLTRLTHSTDFAIIEMGASQRGDIAQLVAMALPDIALVNNVSAAHITGFGDIAGVAASKAEIYSHLATQATAIVNNDCPFVASWQRALAGKNVCSFAIEKEADFTVSGVQLDVMSSHFMVKLNDELTFINLPLPGMHNVANALAAVAVASSLHLPIAAIIQGLSTMISVPHRLQLRVGPNQSKLLDDSYNANPASYHHALQVCMTWSGQHWLVLGDFAELGEESVEIHKQMGRDAKQAGISRLWTIGEQSQLASSAYGEGAEHFDTVAELKQSLQKVLTDKVICLIKGSRCMQLDKLADQLVAAGGH